MPKILGENVDRICTVEMRIPGSAPRGYLMELYDAARAEGGGDPLSLRAATLLMEHCKPGLPVFIFCGAGVPPHLPYGETDGPLGGAALARAINVATGAMPILVSSPLQAPPIAAAARAAGLQVIPYEWAQARPRWAAVEELYRSTTPEAEEAGALIDRYRPTIMISVECLGPNKDDITSSAMGYPVKDNPAYHNFFRLAAERGIPTIGIGDGGNEIGCGRIQDAVRRRFPETPGGCDVATVIPTDVLMIAAVSNWGAYGISAMLSYLSRKPDALHTSDHERRMLDAICLAGAAEGAYMSLNPDVDLIDGRVHADLVNTLRVMVRNASTELHRSF